MSGGDGSRSTTAPSGATAQWSRPYVDRPVADLDTAERAARQVADELGLDRPELLRHGMNAVFSSGHAVLRVSLPTVDPSLSLELAGALETAGIAVPRPWSERTWRIGEHCVTVWEAVTDAGRRVDWAGVGEAVRRLHEAGEALVPAGFPVPSPTAFPWMDLAAVMGELAEDVAELLGHEASATIADVVARCWQPFQSGDSTAVLCHGDVHPGNVIQTDRGPVLLDWDLVCRAPAGWDHAALLRWTERWGGEAGVYDAFAAGYGRSLRGDPFAEAVADLRLAAATLMQVRRAGAEPAAADEARRRARWWRGDPDAPAWSAR